MEFSPWTILWIFTGCLHILGMLSAIGAIMTARTPQGSAAWAVSLIAFPYITLPLYWVFGRGRFVGYAVRRHKRDLEVRFLRHQEAISLVEPIPGVAPETLALFESLAKMRFRIGNEIRLLRNGHATFDAIFKGIDEAQDFLLIQFYIVREADGAGTAFKERVMAAARRGVRVYFLYDEIGSRLSNAYLKEMRAAGVHIRPFRNLKGPKSRLQLNFRNHRKSVIVDGKRAFVGGLNIGDDYLGLYPKRGFWRDTHVAIQGPAVAQAQVAFMEDWHWSSGELPDVRWHFAAAKTPGKAVLVLPSAPADSLETFSLFSLAAIHAARHRVWISTPYFVPDTQILSALQLAALRGVDVRILIPAKNDNPLCELAHFSYLKSLLPSGVKMFRYESGFLHQKVCLFDDALSTVGTANFDNRSFRLNFEITIVVADLDFGRETQTMLEGDFAQSSPIELKDLQRRSFFFKLAVQISRLLAPVL